MHYFTNKHSDIHTKQINDYEEMDMHVIKQTDRQMESDRQTNIQISKLTSNY